MPLRMPAGRLLYIAGVRLMSKRTERLADFLRFLAGYENLHFSSLLVFRKHSLDRLQLERIKFVPVALHALLQSGSAL